MKKILIILLLSLTLVGCTNKNTKPIEITYKELLVKVENKETFPLLIGAKTCSACQLFEPKLEKVISKYNLKVYYIDIEKLGDDDNLDNIVRFTGTPTLAFIKDGEETSSYNRLENGNASSNEIIKIMTKNGYIEGE